MEPLSALAIATSVVQFIDFTSKVVSGSHELYKSTSGLTSSQTNLKEVAEKLRDLSSSVVRPLKSDLPAHHTNTLAEICQGARQAAEELIEALDCVSVKSGQRWESCYQALRSVWREQRITALQERLDSFRQQLTLILVVILRDEVHSAQQSADQGISDIHKTFLDFIDENRKWRMDIAKAIQKAHASEGTANENVLATRIILTSEPRPSADEFARLLRTPLKFSGIEDRHEQIHVRYHDTFEWIFGSEKPQETFWSSFEDWLRGPSSLYWITGKAGSGKSTLMKFLHSDKRPESLLTSSNNLPIVKAGFFFWNSGSELQMSQCGLLRTLLSQILDQCPDAASIAFPEEWEIYSLLLAFDVKHWPWIELRRAFLRLADHICSSSNLLLLIDGLDEYNGNHSQLVSFLNDLASSHVSNFKLCVSSRPWPIFEDAFHQRPSLRMQDLTLPDMVLYTSTRFEENQGFKELEIENPQYTHKLVQDIAEKADGVFLWVVLVVQSLLTGLTNGDRIADLQERFDALPEDLEDLFQRIFDDIEPHYRAQASELFQLFRAENTYSLPGIMTFAFADYALEDALAHPTEPMVPMAIQSRLERTRRRINSRCKGLLEIPGAKLSTFSRVSFLHRTVRDFIQDASRWDKIKSIGSPNFDPHLHLSKSYLMQLKIYDLFFGIQGMQHSIRCCLSHISVAQQRNIEPRVQLADALDLSIQKWGPEGLKKLCGTESHALRTGVRWHWTQIKEMVWEGIPQPSTFINYMTWRGWDWYATAKISRGTSIKQENNVVPLLFIAVACEGILSKSDELEENGRFVMFLLENGADPNETFEGKTLFEYFLSRHDNVSRRADCARHLGKITREHGGQWEDTLFGDFGSESEAHRSLARPQNSTADFPTARQSSHTKYEKRRWASVSLKSLFSRPSNVGS